MFGANLETCVPTAFGEDADKHTQRKAGGTGVEGGRGVVKASNSVLFLPDWMESVTWERSSRVRGNA